MQWLRGHMPHGSLYECEVCNAAMSLSNGICTECGSTMPQPCCLNNKQIAKKPRNTYKPRKTPSMLYTKETRTDIKVDMIALVPGVSRAKAEAVVNAYERSMAQVIGASSMNLGCVRYRDKPIGKELGVAIWRALH